MSTPVVLRSTPCTLISSDLGAANVACPWTNGNQLWRQCGSFARSLGPCSLGVVEGSVAGGVVEPVFEGSVVV